MILRPAASRLGWTCFRCLAGGGGHAFALLLVMRSVGERPSHHDAREQERRDLGDRQGCPGRGVIDDDDPQCGFEEKGDTPDGRDDPENALVALILPKTTIIVIERSWPPFAVVVSAVRWASLPVSMPTDLPLCCEDRTCPCPGRGPCSRAAS
jgi:hypothetical protein